MYLPFCKLPKVLNIYFCWLSKNTKLGHFFMIGLNLGSVKFIMPSRGCILGGLLTVKNSKHYSELFAKELWMINIC